MTTRLTSLALLAVLLVCTAIVGADARPHHAKHVHTSTRRPQHAAAPVHLCMSGATDVDRAAAFASSFKSHQAKFGFVANATDLAASEVVLSAFLKYFTMPDSQHLSSQAPQTNSTSPYWNLALAISALVDQVRALKLHNARLDQQAALMTLIDALITTQSASSSGFIREYFDDELWMTAALIDMYELTAADSYLTQAKTLFADVLSTGYNATTGLMWWNRGHQTRATAANGGTMVVALRLHQYDVTGSLAHLVGYPDLNAFASALFQTWNQFTLDDGEVIDNINPDGTKGYFGVGFTYNQALMIQAAQQLSLLPAGGPALQADADQFVSYTLANLTRAGGVLADCVGSACSSDCVQFKAIGFRALVQYAEQQSQRAMLMAQMGATADQLTPVVSALCATQGSLWASVASAMSVAASPEGLLNCQWQEAWPQGGMTVLQGAQNAGVSSLALAARQQHIWLQM